MQKSIEKNRPKTFLSLLKSNFSIEMEETSEKAFKVYPQMPPKQVSHFAKQAVQKKRPIIIQINGGDSISEISGQPFISDKSSRLILKNKNIIYLVKANTIRHIRRKY